MHKIHVLVVCLCVLMVPNGYAGEKDVIEMVAGLSKPPFVMAEQGKGIQLDLVRAALDSPEHPLRFVHVPMARHIEALQRWNIDGVITLINKPSLYPLFLSKPYITYQNVAVSLGEDGNAITQVSQLAGKRVLAFQNARQFLGAEFARNIEKLQHYQEVADQQQQLAQLFSHQVDVIILDVSIFQYYLKRHPEKMYDKPYVISRIFAPRHYVAGFKQKQLRDRFDRGIARLKADGRYQKILQQYL